MLELGELPNLHENMHKIYNDRCSLIGIMKYVEVAHDEELDNL